MLNGSMCRVGGFRHTDRLLQYDGGRPKIPGKDGPQIEKRGRLIVASIFERLPHRETRRKAREQLDWINDMQVYVDCMLL
jgi:hypothetical protein